MDAVIQGQLQSPLLKELGGKVEHRVSHLVHDIPDNAPISSFHKVEIRPYSGDPAIPNQRVRFKIPRSGMLTRMWLRMRARSTVNADSSGNMEYATFFKWVRLLAGNEVLETIYSPAIFSENAKLLRDADFLATMHSGYYLTDENDVTAPLQLNPNINGNGATNHKALDFALHLPFSLFKYRKDALDTDFLNALEIEFEMESPHVRQTQSSYTLDMTVMAKYFTLHSTVSNNIRNTNYLKGVPETLLTSSWWAAQPPVISGENTVATFDISEGMLVTEMVIVFQKPEKQNVLEYLEYSHPTQFGAEVRVFGNSQELMSYATFDPFIPEANYDRLIECPMTSATRSGINGRQTSALHIAIPLTLYGSDEFMGGGLNLKSIVNARVQVSISASERLVDLARDSVKKFDVLKPQLFLKYATLTRLDGDTGSVSVVAN